MHLLFFYSPHIHWRTWSIYTAGWNYSRTCDQPILTTTTNHCTLHSKMCQSRSKHSRDANPILTTLWIMWLLPTSSSIPKLFVFLGFYPKWQIGAALSSLSHGDRAWRSSSLPMHDSYLGLSKTPLTRVFGVRVCSVSLCLFEAVKMCAGCPAPVSLPHMSVIQTHRPDVKPLN